MVSIRSVFVAVITPLLLGCQSSDGPCEDLLLGLSGRYVGPAIAMDNGHTRVHLPPECAFLISRNDEFGKEVKSAWANSRYGEEFFRVILIDIEGHLVFSDDDEVIPSFVVERFGEVSSDATLEEAETQLSSHMLIEFDQTPQ